MIKRILTAAVLAASGVALAAEDPYSVVIDREMLFGDKLDTILINEDMPEFRMTTLASTVGSGDRVGYYTYTGETLTETDLMEKIDASIAAGNNTTLSRRSEGVLTMKDLSAGDKLGFYVYRKDGTVQTDWRFGYYASEEGPVVTSITFNGYGLVYTPGEGIGYTFGRDQHIVIDEFMVVVAAAKDGVESRTAGTPLPGFLPTLLMGSFGLVGAGWRKIRKA